MLKPIYSTRTMFTQRVMYNVMVLNLYENAYVMTKVGEFERYVYRIVVFCIELQFDKCHVNTGST